MSETLNETENKKKKDTVTLLEEGKTPGLLKYVPEGESPKVYLDLIRTHVMGVDRDGKDRPKEDLLLFLYFSKRTGLDPLAKQIYAVYRWDSRLGREKMTIQVGIDGMRLVAQRTGEYGGQDDAEYLPADESAPQPMKAKVTVYRINPKTGERMPISATARWNEYCQKNKDGKPTGLWASMPYNQLAKCAEALALRKGFPNELSGVYAEEEMGQSTNILSGLEAPKKKEQIKVEHGAPDHVEPLTEPLNLPEPVGKMPEKVSSVEQAGKIGNSIVDVRAKIKSMQDRARKESEK